MPVLTQEGRDVDELVFSQSVETFDDPPEEPPFDTESPSPPPQEARPSNNIIEQINFIKPPFFIILMKIEL